MRKDNIFSNPQLVTRLSIAVRFQAVVVQNKFGLGLIGSASTSWALIRVAKFNIPSICMIGKSFKTTCANGLHHSSRCLPTRFRPNIISSSVTEAADFGSGCQSALRKDLADASPIAIATSSHTSDAPRELQCDAAFSHLLQPQRGRQVVETIVWTDKAFHRCASVQSLRDSYRRRVEQLIETSPIDRPYSPPPLELVCSPQLGSSLPGWNPDGDGHDWPQQSYPEEDSFDGLRATVNAGNAMPGPSQSGPSSFETLLRGRSSLTNRATPGYKYSLPCLFFHLNETDRDLKKECKKGFPYVSNLRYTGSDVFPVLN